MHARRGVPRPLSDPRRGAPDRTDSFAFRFQFLHGAQDVLVQFNRAAVDEAMASAGLGRIAVDLSGHPARLLCFSRPALEGSLAELDTLYEGLLEAALSAALGTPVTARCVEERELDARPWRFALLPLDDAAAADRRPGERPDDVVRRLGLSLPPTDAQGA